MHQKAILRMIVTAVALVSAVVVAGCSAEKKEGLESEAGEHAATPAASGSASGAAATGDTILVEAWTDGTGSYYKPNRIEAHPGDVLRFVLKVGVHNVNFLPDSNGIKTGLPPASEMMQLPGQTHDLVVSMQPGEYYFQCDPHAALGMKGHLEVEKE